MVKLWVNEVKITKNWKVKKLKRPQNIQKNRKNQRMTSQLTLFQLMRPQKKIKLKMNQIKFLRILHNPILQLPFNRQTNMINFKYLIKNLRGSTRCSKLKSLRQSKKTFKKLKKGEKLRGGNRSTHSTKPLLNSIKMVGSPQEPKNLSLT